MKHSVKAHQPFELPMRMNRLRNSAQVRAMLQETHLHITDMILPLFIHANLDKKQAIPSMPGHYQLSLNDLEAEIETVSQLGITAVLLFGIPTYKDATGSAALLENGIIPQAIARIKAINPALTVITDLCLCEYTEHGHCGVLNQHQHIDNDATLTLLGQQAVIHAQAGADWIAPSSMTDGMVMAIRQALDKAGYVNTSILSYAAKFCSCLYGPFREAAQGAPQFGDRKTYQMNPTNSREALREAALDVEEGADIIMVKPANWYLDIIQRIKQQHPTIPLCAYQVSGEYAMIKNAAAHGIMDETTAMLESLYSIKRAGADLIISYFAKSFAQLFADQPN